MATAAQGGATPRTPRRAAAPGAVVVAVGLVAALAGPAASGVPGFAGPTPRAQVFGRPLAEGRPDGAGAARATAALWDAAGTRRPAAVFGALLDIATGTPAPAAALGPGDAALGELVTATLDAGRAARAAFDASDLPVIRRLLNRGLLASPVSPEAKFVARRLRSVVDGPAIIAAARPVVTAVERVVASTRPARGTGVPAAGCDLVDERPVLCVSSGADNTYEDDYSVILDLGGDDTYANAAGTGTCLGSNAAVLAERCAAVLVDLAGDDVYRAAPAEPSCGALVVCAHGTGAIGIGVLVDAAGSDRYEAVGALGDRPEFMCNDQSACGGVTAQGTGVLGVGVLADLAGSDVYRAGFDHGFVGADGIEAGEQVIAQGAGVFGGVALLYDALGNDAYRIHGQATGFLERGNPFSPWGARGFSTFAGQGEGAFGFGALVDAAGDDDVSIRVRPDPEAADRTAPSPWGQGAVGGTFAQGVSGALVHDPNFGFLILGPGNAVVSQEVSARIAFPSGVLGQGLGTGFGATGVLDDRGGDDVFRLSSVLEGHLIERCDCEDEVAVILDANADPFIGLRNVGRSLVIGQGGPQGILRDRGGNDRYEAQARTDLRVTSVNERPGGGSTAGVTLVGSAWVAAQGVASLRDDGGDDTYLLSSSRDLSVTARTTPTEDGVEGPATAWARPAVVVANGQAVGEGGGLEDSGGKDSYEARYHADAAATPDPGGRATDGPFLLAVQGTDGRLLDVDAGEADAFHAESALVFDTCLGRYGEAPGWVSGPTLRDGTCSPTWGATAATSTLPPGATTEVAFAAIEHGGTDEDPYADVEVRLTDAAGAPLAGRRVVVVPEFAFTSGDPLVHQLFPWVDPTASSLSAVTDEHGVARGRLALHQTYCERGCTGLTGEYRFRAMFFGEPGRYRPGEGVSWVFTG